MDWQARSQAEAEEAAASSDLAQIDNVLIMCSHDITYHFNIWTLCHSLVKKKQSLNALYLHTDQVISTFNFQQIIF